MGIHWIGPGPYNEELRFCAIHHPPCFVAVNELDKIIKDVKTVSPNTFCMGRLRGDRWPDGMELTGNKEMDYRAGYNRFLERLPYFVGIKAGCFSVFNEWLSQDNPYLLTSGCNAIRGAMDAAKEFGMVLGFGDFNTGQPQLERPEIFKAIQPMLAQGSEQGHILVIHLYPIEGNLKTDKQRLIDRWVPVFEQYPRLRILIGEYASDVKGSNMNTLMVTGDEVLSRWPQIMGCAIFTRGQGWPEYQYDLNILRSYLAYSNKCT